MKNLDLANSSGVVKGEPMVRKMLDWLITGGAKRDVIAVIDLGYVGLLLAVESTKHLPVIGFDIKEYRIDRTTAGEDHARGVDLIELVSALLRTPSIWSTTFCSP